MSLGKQQQKRINQWLKQQGVLQQGYYRLLILIGLLGGFALVMQAWLLASILQALIVDKTAKTNLTQLFIYLIVTIVIRAILVYAKERVGFIYARKIRQQVRRMVLDRLEYLGPAWIQNKPAGSWATIILEQVENIQDYYARYRPQMLISGLIPITILIAIFPVNWAAGLILLFTAPLIPLFMALVGMGAADANKRNFDALAKLSGNFLDRLRGMETLRLFFAGKRESGQIYQASEDFRLRTMDVLKIAFLSSAVLEFFTSVSIAVVAVYFGFSYLGELNFGHYGSVVTLFAGFLVLILAPEFFQPLRDLGTFYHAKAQAVGAADTLETFLTSTAELIPHQSGEQLLTQTDHFVIKATDLVITTAEGKALSSELSFVIKSGQHIAIVGRSGSGKTSLFNVLLGFLPYRGSLTINGTELNQLSLNQWRSLLSWLGQNPYLPEKTIRQNILLAAPQATEQQLNHVIKQAHVDEFLERLPAGVDTEIGEDAAFLSVGQAQRIALARALINPAKILLLDEPTASLDSNSEALVNQVLSETTTQQITLLITHQLSNLTDYDEIWLMDKGKIVQSGSFQQLSSQSGLFASLLASQQAAI